MNRWTEVYGARMLKLADLLDTLPDERFTIAKWVRDDWGGMPDLSCGTSACAMGWATTIPEFQEAGLHLECMTIPIVVLGHGPDRQSGFSAASLFFNISLDHALTLFAYNELGDGGGVEMHGERFTENTRDVSPKWVADDLRRYVAAAEAARYEGARES